MVQAASNQLSLELAEVETKQRKDGPGSKSRDSARVGRARLTLGAAARIIREAVKDKSHRKTPLGQLVGRYLRWFRNEYGATESTIRDYEAVLARMSLLLADREPLDVSTEDLREVIDTGVMRHGHSDLSTTMGIYGHQDQRDLERALEASANAREDEETASRGNDSPSRLE